MKFKQTEIGCIPEHWKVLPIRDVTVAVTDYVANGSFASLAANVSYKDDKDVAVLIRLVDYNNNFQGNFVYIDDHAYNFLSKSKLYGGEIIISNVGANVGTVFRCPTLPYKMSLAPNSIMVKFNENNDFYFHWLKSRNGQQMIKSIVTGSAQPKFNKTNFRQMLVPVPPIEEQNRIAAILNAIDDKINKNRQINDNLEQQLHQLFIQTFNGCDTNISLGKVVKTTSGGTPARKHREYYSNGTINWVKSKELTGQYLFDTEESLTSLGVAMSSAKILPAHSVLIAMYGATVGEHGITTKEMACNQAICALLENKDYPYTYLFQIAKENQQNLVNLAIGSAQQNISQILLKQLSVHSDVATIHQYHCLALPLHKEIELLQSENRLLNTTRDALLPELMTGELDLSSVDF